MKLAGRTLKGPNIQTLVLPRPSEIDQDGKEINNDIVFVATAVIDYSEFEALLPRPEPPMIRRPGDLVGAKDFDDLDFRSAIDRWATYQTHWMFLKSLESTPGLEWETVKMDQPDTWKNFEPELKSAGFSPYEINRITRLCIEVNALSEEKIKEAKARFLAIPATGANKSVSRRQEPPSTLNGVPVNVSASSPVGSNGTGTKTQAGSKPSLSPTP